MLPFQHTQCQNIKRIQENHCGIAKHGTHQQTSSCHRQNHPRFLRCKVGVKRNKNSQQAPVMHQFKLRALHPFWQKIQVYDQDTEGRKLPQFLPELMIQSQAHPSVNKHPCRSQKDDQILRTSPYPHMNRRKKSCQKTTELMRFPHVPDQPVTGRHPVSQRHSIGLVQIQTDPDSLQERQDSQHCQNSFCRLDRHAGKFFFFSHLAKHPSSSSLP